VGIESSSSSPPEYAYPGARSLVLLHERSLRSLHRTWRKAKAAGVVLPKTDDPAYASPETLLAHVCSAARGYMIWMCEVLELPDPEIRTAPAPTEIEEVAGEYIDHLTERWRRPLARVAEKRFYRPEHSARWKVRYCVDAMLEHAVMHPVRHEFQLETLIHEQGGEAG
jgi:hypothetical protein